MGCSDFGEQIIKYYNCGKKWSKWSPAIIKVFVSMDLLKNK